MARRSSAGDPHFDDSSGLLRNTRGFTSQPELDRFERDIAFAALIELEIDPVLGEFDIVHLRAIHRRIFGKIYPWAGELRHVNISRPASYPFALIQFMRRNLDKTLANLAAEHHLKAMAVGAFVDRAAFYLGELSSLHPFREGNGRTLREFLRELAAEAGYKLNWSLVTQKQMYDAAEMSHNLGKNHGFAEVIRLAL